MALPGSASCGGILDRLGSPTEVLVPSIFVRFLRERTIHARSTPAGSRPASQDTGHPRGPASTHGLIGGQHPVLPCCTCCNSVGLIAVVASTRVSGLSATPTAEKPMTPYRYGPNVAGSRPGYFAKSASHSSRLRWLRAPQSPLA
jgi:hypothetical protein